jgi:acetyl esterase/lipase
MKNYYLLLSFAILLSSCEALEKIGPGRSKVSLGEKLTSSEITSYTITWNMKYGENGRQLFDLHMPVKQPDSLEKQHPAVSLVMVHGGGWSLLDKYFITVAVEDFKRRGLNLAIFNVNHRLAGTDGVTYEDMIEDFDLFFKTHKSLKDSLNLSDEILLWGYSSGGHLLMSYAYTHPSDDFVNIAAIASPTDLTDPHIRTKITDSGRNLTELLIGQPYDSNPDAYKNASPYYLAGRHSTSTSLFYGGNDYLVDKSQGEKLNKVLLEKKVKSEFHLVEDAGHEMDGKMPQIADELIRYWKTL